MGCWFGLYNSMRCINRDNRFGGGGPVPQRGHHHERFPPPTHPVSAGHHAAKGRAPSGGPTVYETWGCASFHPL